MYLYDIKEADKYLETNLDRLLVAGQENELANQQFAQYLLQMDPALVDQKVHALNDKIAPKIDCTACGNCCKTLLININTVGINQTPVQNTIKVFPNPANTHVTIDYGNFASLNGYQLKIENSLGQQVFQTAINQQSNYLDLSNWGGNGIYFVRLIDPQGNTVDIRKIVLQ